MVIEFIRKSREDLH